MTSLTPPGRTAHSFGFTPVDLTSSYDPPAAGAGSWGTSHAYNLDRQPTLTSRPDGSSVVTAYDSAGRPATVTLARGQLVFGYDAAGRLATVSSPDGVTLTHGHDGSLPVSQAWSGVITGSVSSSFNNNLQLTTLTVAGSAQSFSYDSDGLLTAAGGMAIARDAASGYITGTTLSQLTTSQSYSAFGELSSTAASHGASALYSTSYTRDALGRITQRDETVQGVNSSTVYSYDAAGRLDVVTQDGVIVADYDYDANGNRTQISSEVGITLSATHDAQDRLLTYGPKSYTYSQSGELQSRTSPTGTTQYTYDELGNLLSVTLESGTTISYLIDGQGRRVGKKVGGALVQGWLYKDQLNPVAELDGAGAVVSRFIYGSKPHVPDLMEKGGNTYRILSDHLGSVRLVVDVATGSVAQRLDYDEYGVVLQDTNPGFQPFGFAGGLYDHQTKLVRFGARDYDAEVGRWTSKDPIRFEGGDGNLYAYVGWDPVNWVDIVGMDSLEFDGSFLHLKDNKGNSIGKWPGISGWRKDYYKKCLLQMAANFGPIPSGKYHVRTIQVQDMPKSKWDEWGRSRVAIHPDKGTETHERSGFYIHGGKEPGSSGCIDLAPNAKPFFDRLKKYKNVRLPLNVSYKCK